MPVARKRSRAPVQKAIERAERLLPGESAAGDRRDPRWQAVVKVAEYIEDHPSEVRRFARKWGAHADADLRAAIATCLIEHLLEYHFEAIIPLVEEACDRSKRFADTVAMCWQFGQAETPGNQRRFRRLLRKIRKHQP